VQGRQRFAEPVPLVGWGWARGKCKLTYGYGYRLFADARAWECRRAAVKAVVGRRAPGLAHRLSSGAGRSSPQRARELVAVSWAAEPAGTSLRGHSASTHRCASRARAARLAGAHRTAGHVPSRSPPMAAERRYATCCPRWQFIRNLKVHDPLARQAHTTCVVRSRPSLLSLNSEKRVEKG